jgi:hypothetical protein
MVRLQLALVIVRLLPLLALGGCNRFLYEERRATEPDTSGVPSDADVDIDIDGGHAGAAGSTGEGGAMLPDGGEDAAALDAGMDASACDPAIERRAITVTYAVPETLTNFPLLVSLSGSWLQSSAYSPAGRVAHENGWDISFEGEDAQPLDHEIERYDPQGGTLVAWVRIPALSEDTTLYIEYGDCNALASSERKQEVWPTQDFAAVWHLAGDAESTATASDATNNGALDDPDAKIGDGRSFDATNSVMVAGSQDPLDRLFVDGGSISAWIRPSGEGEAGYGTIAAKLLPDPVCSPPPACDPSENGWAFFTSHPPAPNEQNTIGFRYHWDVLNGHWQTGPPHPLFDGSTWYWVVVQYAPTDASAIPDFYIDGQPVSAATFRPAMGTVPADDRDYVVTLGSRINQERTFDGVLDEVRLLHARRSARWIATEYENQNDPAGFYELGDPVQ